MPTSSMHCKLIKQARLMPNLHVESGALLTCSQGYIRRVQHSGLTVFASC